jgi:dolichol-phosphate mannosyltransferase
LPPYLSIIVPTLNEAPNLPELSRRIHAAVSPITDYELLIIDDNSKDNTKEVCATLAQQYPLTLHTRTTPKDGLSGAVLHGFALARGQTLLVIDADLQHPPESIPALLAALNSGAEFALGSRYIAGGGIESSWSAFRRLNSTIATLLARPFSGRVTDPMSGFFALRRETFNRATHLSPLGYKIALELICKCRVNKVTEVPIHFGLRHAGQSKLTLKQQFKYLEHLSRLYDFTFPRASPILKFLIATILSWATSLLLLIPLLAAGNSPLRSIALSFPLSLLTLAAFHYRYVKTQREFLPRQRPWTDFTTLATCEYAAALLTAAWLQSRTPNLPVAETIAITFTLAAAVRYALRKELLADIRGLRQEPRA